MPSSHAADRRYEPTYVNSPSDLKQRDIPPPARTRPPPPRAGASYDPQRRAPGPRRAQTYRQPRRYSPPSSSGSDSSPPPRQRRRSPRSRPYDEYDGNYAQPRHRRHREEDYFSDNRHNRPRRDPHDDRPPRDTDRERHRSSRDRDRDRGREARRDRPSKPKREESKWEKEAKNQAKNLFKEYAVPAIKAEGGKFVTKQLGNLLGQAVK